MHTQQLISYRKQDNIYVNMEKLKPSIHICYIQLQMDPYMDDYVIVDVDFDLYLMLIYAMFWNVGYFYVFYLFNVCLG